MSVWFVNVFRSWVPSLMYCYARVIEETCSSSSADINVLKTLLYSSMLSSSGDTACILGRPTLQRSVADSAPAAATCRVT